jgi:serine/threonine-protein kinase
VTLAAGARLGSYEIQAAIGAGGMGEVYRATDTVLKRQVALKVLPPEVANDPERVARFQREAEVLASLNHPNIAHLYGLERSGGTLALVMELVEGPTLADRIAQGAIPVDEALPIAKQIAEALEAAHEQGIIHRDLKPANIKVREDGTVKVLDFGLAKLADTAPSHASGALANSPTITSPALMTGVGVLLGTAAYMSPEQAKGRPADKRSDIWAFGCVLYEMLAGKRAFEADDVSETLASVLRSEPDWPALPPTVSPTVQLLLRRSLEKDRRARIPDIAAVRFLMDERLPAVAADAIAVVRPQTTMRFAGAALVLAALAATAAWHFKPSPAPAPAQPVSFTFSPAAGPITTPSPFRDVAISPDGRTIVYGAGASEGQSRLYVRNLDDLDARPLTDVASGAPFFSPDGRWIGFVAAPQRELRKVPIGGGPSTRLCTIPGIFEGATWLPDGRIAFGAGAGASAIYIVSAVGGTPERLTKPSTGPNQVRYALPAQLPDGHHLLVSVGTGPGGGNASTNRTAVFNIDTKEEKIIINDGTQAEYVAGGFLVYATERTLRATRFDLETLTAQPDSAVLAEGLPMKAASGAVDFSISPNGTLVYVRGAGSVGAQRSLVWVDRNSGNETMIAAPLRPYTYARLSPDGSRIALDIRDETTDIWVWDIAREQMMRLTKTPELETSPVWTPDGRRIIFGSTRDGGAATLFALLADGSESEFERLADGNLNQVPSAMTPDGRLLFTQQAAGGQDAMLLRLDGDHRIEPLIQTDGSKENAVVSPDGQLVAYQSNESGSTEVWVRPFPETKSKRYSISTNGGTRPLWAPNGKELFYLDMEGFLTSVSIRETPQFDAGKPSRVFQTRYFAGGQAMNARTYDISPDGKRLLMIKDGATVDTQGTSVIVLVNGTETLRAKLTALSGTTAR